MPYEKCQFVEQYLPPLPNPPGRPRSPVEIPCKNDVRMKCIDCGIKLCLEHYDDIESLRCPSCYDEYYESEEEQEISKEE